MKRLTLLCAGFLLAVTAMALMTATNSAASEEGSTQAAITATTAHPDIGQAANSESINVIEATTTLNAMNATTTATANAMAQPAKQGSTPKLRAFRTYSFFSAARYARIIA